MKNRIALSFLCRVVAALVLVAGLPSLAAAQQDGKLDAVLRDRSTRLAGWSRVIVEFTGEPDVRVFGRGTTGRRVGQQMQAGEVENTALASLAADGRVKKVWADRPAFPTFNASLDLANGLGMAAPRGGACPAAGCGLPVSFGDGALGTIQGTSSRPLGPSPASIRPVTRRSFSARMATCCSPLRAT